MPTTVDIGSMFIHPKPRMDEFVNNAPVEYTLLVASIFLFTSLIFIAYDWLVARRQHIVMRQAVQSTAIVSSLYPKQVRDRLFKDEEKDSTRPGTWMASGENNKSATDLTLLNGPPHHARSDRPIADLYEHCTVLFADLAGFTMWSSTRKPEDVFYLLETLYQTFDRIAVRRNVFKVETIGDCYVAVTGVPNPQTQHAAIMVKFARDCYAKMNLLLPDLADKLGEDTARLNFRVGLHSGSVTGGVLRGAKSRFQLFGDTINTASRIESTGVPGRIHISQATADELQSMGYGKWVTPREDKVTAKGKGEMQTYFVGIQQYAKSMASTMFSAGENTMDSSPSSTTSTNLQSLPPTMEEADPEPPQERALIAT